MLNAVRSIESNNDGKKERMEERGERTKLERERGNMTEENGPRERERGGGGKKTTNLEVER